MYYQSRYYDPEIGAFISPDSIVPDAENLFDYNRYMYARGRPLNMNDPSGHCAMLEDGGPDIEGDQGCWDAADEWRKTFGLGGYETVDDWQRYFAGQTAMTEDVFRTVLYEYWAPQYQAMGVYHQRYNPPPQMHPLTAQDQAFEQFVHKVSCENPANCVTNTLDAVSTGGAFVAAACTLATGGICAIVAAPAGAISIAAGGVGVSWTAYQVTQGNGTETDLSTATSTFTIGAARSIGGEVAQKVNPWIGLAASVYQWYYDNHPPSHSSHVSQQ